MCLRPSGPQELILTWMVAYNYLDLLHLVNTLLTNFCSHTAYLPQNGAEGLVIKYTFTSLGSFVMLTPACSSRPAGGDTASAGKAMNDPEQKQNCSQFSSTHPNQLHCLGGQTLFYTSANQSKRRFVVSAGQVNVPSKSLCWLPQVIIIRIPLGGISFLC